MTTEEIKTKEEAVSLLGKGLKQEFSKEVLNELKVYIDAYNTIRAEEIEQKKAAFVEEEGQEAEEYFEAPKDDADLKFSDLLEEYAEKKRKYEAHLKAIADKNVTEKEDVITQLENLVSEEEHIPTAFNKLKELKERWKNIGDVPNHKYRELEDRFSRGVDNFYYNIKIYKELLDHDLKKNLEKKEDLIKRLEKIVVIKNIKETERVFKALQQEWYEIGPTFKEQWEEVKERYHHAAGKVYDKIKTHYNEIKERNKVNLEKKRELITEMESLVKPLPDSPKAWKKRTDMIKALQAKWKEVGPVSRKVSDAVFKEFNDLANEYFEARGEELKEERAAQKKVAERKAKLVERAKTLCELPDNLEEVRWPEVTRDIIQLQKDWKRSGVASRKDEQRLWNEFRAPIDAFFEARKEFEAGADDREAANAEKKKAIIEEVKKWKPSDDKDANKEAIQSFQKRWREIGFVPKKDIKTLNADFDKAINAQMKAIGWSEVEMKATAYQTKLKSLSGKDDNLSALQKERGLIQNKLKQAKEQVAKYETNLSFFSGSKDNPLLAEATKNLASTEEEVAQLTAKLKAVNIAINAAKKEEN